MKIFLINNWFVHMIAFSELHILVGDNGMKIDNVLKTEDNIYTYSISVVKGVFLD